MDMAEEGTRKTPAIVPAIVMVPAIAQFLSGAILLAGGAYLVRLGGSFYYAICGAVLIAVALLLWRGRCSAGLLYAALLIGSFVWALAEAGLNGWALLPRMGFLCGMGLLFLAPATLRHLGLARHAAYGARALAGIILLIIVGVAFVEIDQPWGPEAADGTPASTPGTFAPTDWLAWGGDQGGQRHAPAGQITPANVSGLQVAWTYATGAAPRPGGAPALAFEVTPLKIGNRLYGCTPHNILFALDAVTGREIWRHDPHTNDQGLAFANCRGVAYADLSQRGIAAPAAAGGHDGAACTRRLYTGTIDARLLAVDADTGETCTGFGTNGAVDMRANLAPHERSYYYYTSAPTVSGNVVMIGSYGLDGQRLVQPSGVVRAYDLVTGAQTWAFDPADPGHKIPFSKDKLYEAGTPNSWSVSSTDEKLGLIYVPFGVATPDYYGGQRPQHAETFGNAIVALDNRTGDVRWSFQVVHHDIWDYDIAAQPVLTDFPVDGRMVPALITVSKTGEVFVLDRATGKPLMPIEERRVPVSDAPGEHSSPTQPFSPDMPNFAGGLLTEAQMWGLTPFDQLWCRVKFHKLRYEGRFTPPSLQGSLQYPGFAGGVNWGSISIDPERQLAIVNSNRLPTMSRLITPEEVAARGMKPAGAGVHISPEAVRAGVPQQGAHFGVLNGTFLSPLTIPCLQPPMGQISAIDLRTHRIAWQRPLGTADRMGPMGIATHLPLPFGLPTVGGSITTSGGLTFIASTPDHRIHAIETATGKLLWQADLPANGNATPMSYIGADGRQYVVIAAGGSAALASNEKNVLVAFAVK